MHYIIKIQSCIRGYRARQRTRLLREQYTTMQFNSGYLEINEEAYNDPRIFELMQRVGKFTFEGAIDDGQERKKLPLILLENGAKYEGEWLSGRDVRDGRGIQIWSDGSRYEGYWRNNRAHGKGRLIHSDGDIYEGQWKDDKAHGFGKYVHVDGSSYEGYWKEDL
jgi:hypothetical protein